MPLFFRKTRRELASRAVALAEKAAALEKKEEDLAEREVAVRRLASNRIAGFEYVARAWADWEIMRAERDAEYLKQKKRPALKGAEVVAARGRELAEERRRRKLAEYVTGLYEWHFPWLTELREFEEEESYLEVAEASESSERNDPVRRWLSKDEWQALPEAERNQRALDRYLRSRLTPWQIGRDYERYVGYLREAEGCIVTYHGIVKGFDDLGRDILAERDGIIEVIQCKRWASHKQIHEKHIFQLFGTMTAARIENPMKTVIGTFTTSTSLSERARDFAEVLEISVEEDFPPRDYPRIKCNVGRATGERIYHLPFDQRYDSTKVEPGRGERYVRTVAEAEALGFRRAWRWRGAG